MVLSSTMPVCIAMVRLTRMGPIPLLFEITRVPVTDRNAFHRKRWFDLLLPKASAQIERQQSKSSQLGPCPSQHHHLRHVTCRVILAPDYRMSSLFRESSAFRSACFSR